MIYTIQYDKLVEQLKELFEHDDDMIVREMLQGIDCYIQACEYYIKGNKKETFNKCFLTLQYVSQNLTLITNGDTEYGE